MQLCPSTPSTTQAEAPRLIMQLYSHTWAGMTQSRGLEEGTSVVHARQ